MQTFRLLKTQSLKLFKVFVSFSNFLIAEHLSCKFVRQLFLRIFLLVFFTGVLPKNIVVLFRSVVVVSSKTVSSKQKEKDLPFQRQQSKCKEPRATKGTLISKNSFLSNYVRITDERFQRRSRNWQEQIIWSHSFHLVEISWCN